jgi:1-acyl-sn-glycerol-3-phosphate acyltransferase
LLVLSWTALKLTGWKIVCKPPTEPKYVLVAAPHTSNWDFPLLIAMA